MNETKSWICDSCQSVIESAEDGWVEWLHVKGPGDNWHSRGLRLVHQRSADQSPSRCQYDGQALRAESAIVADQALTSLLGTDGLMQLLAMASERDFENPSEILEMIQRLHIPGYEAARRHFGAAIAEGIIEPNLPRGFHWQRDIRAVLDWAKQEGRS